MKNTYRYGALVLSLSLMSCVSASKHKAMVADLESQLEQSRDKNRESQESIQALESRLLSTSKDKGALQSSLDDTKKALNEMKERRAEEQKRLKEFQDLTKRFKKLTDSGALSVKIVDGKMVVSLGSDVLFAPGSARLSKEGIQAVKDVNTQLMSIPNKRYQIEGHTDNAPISTANFPSNWELASARAISVLKTMVESGMPAERISAASYGDTQPAKANDSAEGKAANRRIAIVIVPDLSSLPGYDELQKYAQ